MRSQSGLSSSLSAALLIWCGTGGSLPAITVGDLQKELAGTPRLTLIDLRSPLLFAQGHIVGAINVPASLCAHRSLPPLGKVIAYDGGLGKETTEAAVRALAAKPGLTVDVLEGGFAAWETARAQSTRMKGVQREKPNYISYAELKSLAASDVVLVDLRSTTQAPAPAMKTAIAVDQPLTDLAQEFPGRKVSRSPFELPAPEAKSSAPESTPPLLVLIDHGDGVSEGMARTLEANGTKRYVILTGGELVLARQGQPGKQRSSPASHVTATSLAPAAPTQK